MSPEKIPTAKKPTKQRAKPGVAIGTVEWVRNRYVAKVSLKGSGKRIRVEMPDANGRPKYTDKLRDRAQAQVTAASISHGMRKVTPAHSLDAGMTVEEFGVLWTSGELFRRYGEIRKLKIKLTAEDDRQRLEGFIYPYIGKKPVAVITEQDIGHAFNQGVKAYKLRHYGRDPAQGTKQQVYAVAHRLFELAIRPGRLRETNPVTDDMRPSKGKPKIYSYLLPQELLSVLACTEIPIDRRVGYAIAVYTFQRKGSLMGMVWEDVDLQHSTIVSLVNKTSPQLFAQKDAELPGYESLIELLRRWREHCGWPGDKEPIVKFRDQKKRDEAKTLRNDLILAGVTRPILFQSSQKVVALRYHDLRATGITWAKRVGKSDGWISDRSGHSTPAMINRYNRAARHLEDLQIDVFPDISSAIPELRDVNVTRLPTKRKR